MQTRLDEILARTRQTVRDGLAMANLSEMEVAASRHSPRGFEASIRTIGSSGVAVIAELKKASPSKGLLRADYRPAETAQGYARVGAAAISVLTDADFFQGSVEDLGAVSAAVSIPVLRKDFILDPFQILEARAAGADAILLIVAAHTDADLSALAESARSMALDILCEVHDREELTRAIDLGFNLIGVNCRDLKTLEVDPMTHMRLAEWLPFGTIRVAESGIRTSEDVSRLLGAGYDAFLIGETLIRQPDPAAALALLLDADYSSTLVHRAVKDSQSPDRLHVD